MRPGNAGAWQDSAQLEPTPSERPRITGRRQSTSDQRTNSRQSTGDQTSHGPNTSPHGRRSSCSPPSHGSMHLVPYVGSDHPGESQSPHRRRDSDPGLGITSKEKSQKWKGGRPTSAHRALTRSPLGWLSSKIAGGQIWWK